MGLFDSIAKAVDTAKSIKNAFDKFQEQAESLKPAENAGQAVSRVQEEELVILPGTHEVEDFYYGDKDAVKNYRASYSVSDSFKEADSHSEITMLCSYAPYSEQGEEGVYPSLFIDADDCIYRAVESYKKTGSVNGALEFTEQNGKFYFRAKIRYYQKYLCCFYGFDREGGLWKNHGLCMVYPESYLGTENEKKLIKVLDDAAATYREELTEG